MCPPPHASGDDDLPLSNATSVTEPTPTPGRISPKGRLAHRFQRDLVGAWKVVSSMPPIAWVTTIVVVSTLYYASYGGTVAAPFVFSDELIHARLAFRIASGHVPPLREALAGYGVIAPIVAALPLRLGGDMVRGYALLKTFNSFVMSCAAVPAYLVAQRMLRPRPAVVVAALTVAVPSMVFTALVMRESVFYPLFLCVVLLIVRSLERPTAPRQLAALSGVAAAYVTRPQAIVILPAYLAAILFNAWLGSRSVDADVSPLRRYRTWDGNRRSTILRCRASRQRLRPCHIRSKRPMNAWRQTPAASAVRPVRADCEAAPRCPRGTCRRSASPLHRLRDAESRASRRAP